MMMFELKVAWRSKATVYVNAGDLQEATEIYKRSSHLPDADEIEDEELLSVAQVDPNTVVSPEQLLVEV